MKKNVILAEEEVFNVNIQMMIFLTCLVIGAFLSQSKSEYNILSNDMVSSVLFVSIYTFLRSSRKVILKNKTIIAGVEYLGFLFKKESFPISDIKEIVLNKNEELYFELAINRNNNKRLIVKKMPNKNPAAAQLKLIEDHIKQAE